MESDRHPPPSENWDTLASTFDTSSIERSGFDASDFEFGVAANIIVAWAAVLDGITQFASGRKLKVLDFGCGGGGFAKWLLELGHSVVGIDRSDEMILKARTTTNIGDKFYTGDEQSILEFDQFDVVAMNCVTNYLADLTLLVNNIRKRLAIGGLLIFSELFPEYVKACIKRKIIYSNFSAGQFDGTAKLNFNIDSRKVPIDIWLRTASTHESFFDGHGFSLTKACFPNLPSGFSELKFRDSPPHSYPFGYPRYQILHFRLLS